MLYLMPISRQPIYSGVVAPQARTLNNRGGRQVYPASEQRVVVMGQVKPKKRGVTLALTVGVLFLLCALVVISATASMAALPDIVAHGGPLKQQVGPISLSAVLGGTLVMTAYVSFAALLFGLIWKFVERMTNARAKSA